MDVIQTLALLLFVCMIVIVSLFLYTFKEAVFMRFFPSASKLSFQLSFA